MVEGAKDKAEAKAIAIAANIPAIEAMAKAGALSRAIIAKLVVGGNITVGEAITEWSAWLSETAGSDRTALSHSDYVNLWVVRANLHMLRLADITESQISNWVNARDDFFRFCASPKRNWLSYDPAREVKVKGKWLSHEQKEATVRQCFTDAEVDQVTEYLLTQIECLMSLPPTTRVRAKIDTLRFWRCAVLIGRYSGLRLGDICSLEWASIKEPERLIVHTTKKNTRVDLESAGALAQALALIPANQSKHCFPEQNEIARTANKRAAMSVQFGRILTACKIEGRSFHSLRHSRASELNAQGESMKSIAAALGHGSESSTAVYIH